VTCRRLQQLGPAADDDFFADASEIEPHVHFDSLLHVQGDAGLDRLAEAGQLGGDGIAPDLQGGKHELPFVGRHGRHGRTGGFLRRGDGGAGHDRRRLIANGADDGAGVELRERRSRGADYEQRRKRQAEGGAIHAALCITQGRVRQRRVAGEFVEV